MAFIALATESPLISGVTRFKIEYGLSPKSSETPLLSMICDVTSEIDRSFRFGWSQVWLIHPKLEASCVDVDVKPSPLTAPRPLNAKWKRIPAVADCARLPFCQFRAAVRSDELIRRSGPPP